MSWAIFKEAKDMESKKKLVGISILIVLAAALLFGAYYLLNPSQKGAKEIRISVVDENGQALLSKMVHTDAESLSALLDENKLATFQQSSYGRFITAVNGVTADPAKQQWWNIGYNGADASVGADDLKIKNGDKIVLTLKTGY
jgi:hypothetical protein